MLKQPVSCKLVVVGDQLVDKNHFLRSFRDGKTQKGQFRQQIDNFHKIIIVENQNVKIRVINSHGSEQLQHLRGLLYFDTDVFMILFSMNKPQTFHNAYKKWKSEAIKVVNSSFIIFVGIDELQQESSKVNMNPIEAPITKQKAYYVIEKQHKCKYMECSYQSLNDINNIFNEVGKIALQKKLASLLAKKQNPNSKGEQVRPQNYSIRDIPFIENLLNSQSNKDCTIM